MHDASGPLQRRQLNRNEGMEDNRTKRKAETEEAVSGQRSASETGKQTRHAEDGRQAVRQTVELFFLPGRGAVLRP